MDYALSEEQTAVRDAIRGVLADLASQTALPDVESN